jgi:FKBP-type peptidyl-prolyl cis-trans isomerase FkpA
MKRSVFLSSVIMVIVLAFYALGCAKSSSANNCTNRNATDDSGSLKTFAAINSISPVPDPTGIYYQILDSGTGSHPIAGSVLFVTYTARLMNGSIFDSTSNPDKTGFLLGNLIKGWQIGLPKIGTGGHIELLVPSTYGYGCTGYLSVPPNAPLFFDVRLVSFQ